MPMKSAHIATAIARVRVHLRSHAEDARSIGSEARARVIDGLHVEVAGLGGYLVTTDMPEVIGGTGSAPSPGWFMRAGLAACEATVIAMMAAEEGIVLTDLEVAVTSESDDRGLLGLDAVVPGPRSVNVRIRVASDAPASRLRKVIERAEARSPVGDGIRRQIPVDVEIEVAPSTRRTGVTPAGMIARG
jgi:uncharacterized OsmC-like protein